MIHTFRPPPPKPPLPLGPPPTHCLEAVYPALPPPDEEAKNRIEKLVSYIARNGPAFEDTVKAKEKGNEQFSFLFQGEYSPYYRWRALCAVRKYSVDTIRQILEQHACRMETIPPGSLDLCDNDKSTLQELIRSNDGSKDAIRQLRKFAILRSHSAAAIAIAMKQYSMQCISSRTNNADDTRTTFVKLLYLVYVINDIFFNRSCASFKGPYTEFMEELRPKWEPSRVDLVAIFLPLVYQVLANAYTHASDPAEKEKLIKIVELWVSKRILSDEQASLCRRSMLSTSDFQHASDPQVFSPYIQHLPPSNSAPPSSVSSGLAQRSFTYPPHPQPAHPPPRKFQPPPPPPPEFRHDQTPVGSQKHHSFSRTNPNSDLDWVPVGIMSNIIRDALKSGHSKYSSFSSTDVLRPAASLIVDPARLQARVNDFYQKLYNTIPQQDFTQKRPRSNSFTRQHNM